MAIVREKVEKLGGLISIETTLHLGTTFRIFLPVTLATFRGVIVQAAGQKFVVPTTNVEQVVRITPDNIKTVENKTTIALDGRAISLVRLADVLELPQRDQEADNSKFIPVLLLGTVEKRIAFSIDKVLSEQEVLVKSLGKQLSRVRNIAGATVLGSGQVIPILNVPDLIKSAIQLAPIAFKTPLMTPEKVETAKKSILLVEDSVTSRMLLKGILESAGYTVKTAVDGVEAFTLLKTEMFHLVVSDIEMPRMNGFDLTSRIRSDQELADLPVILVTSLEAREHRERGIEVGANAYIVKSSFDQSNLLEITQRLI
jgi:two-component system chemotaxis sensor kinase CheA